MLRVQQKKYHKVQDGQTLSDIARAYHVAERLLVQENGLQAPPKKGQILKIPENKGNAYTVKAGESKSLLCGNEENYRTKNGTDIFYIGMRVIL